MRRGTEEARYIQQKAQDTFRTLHDCHVQRSPLLEMAIAPHVRLSPDGKLHLREREVRNGDGARTHHLEAGFLVERNQHVLAHERGASHVGQATEVLQVAPHQDGTFALLTEGPVDRQHVDVDRVAIWLVKSQCVLLSKMGIL